MKFICCVTKALLHKLREKSLNRMAVQRQVAGISKDDVFRSIIWN